ncbi:hypothetical protein PV327_002378 [Microctonus hyperodae]|nr:hypothetical protein PV327_002378 [Microctonus hyperodae]
MVDDKPDKSDETNESASKQLLMNERTNGINWQTNENDDDSSDKEDDDEVEEANHESGKFDDLLNQNYVSICSHLSEPPEIKVTIDDNFSQMAHEYRGNFDGFAEINRFNTIEDMHDFIKNSLELSTSSETTSIKQEHYLDILLNEEPENRFKKLFDTSRSTVRRVLSRNDEILRELFSSANLDNFPSPLALDDGNNINEDGDNDIIYGNSRDIEVEENMKRWYMIEMIGLWLKLITDVTSYREAIKRHVLKKSWGIENDCYEGIAMPLKYK